MGALATSLFLFLAVISASFIPQQAFADEWRTVTQTTHVNFEFSDGFVPPDVENAGNTSATLAETGDILPIALAVLVVAGCGVAAFVLISRRNVVANSGPHAGVSSVSNSVVRKASVLALVATLVLTSAFSFSKAFAGTSSANAKRYSSIELDENGYAIAPNWWIDVAVNELGKVTNVTMTYSCIDPREEMRLNASTYFYQPIRCNSESYQWIYSLFPENAQNDLRYPYLDAGTPNLYPNDWYYSWSDIVEEFPGENYSLRDDLIADAYYNGGIDITIPFEQQTKFDWTFDYGYEGSTSYVATIDWKDVYSGNVSEHVSVPSPARSGYEFAGCNRVYSEGWGNDWPLSANGDIDAMDDFVYVNREGDVIGFVAQWKQVDSTNDIDRNDDQTDSVDSDLNADTPDVTNSEDGANKDNAEAVDSSETPEGTKEGDQADQTV